MANEQLAAALLGGGGNAVLGLDPALLEAQSEMQTGQALQQQGMSTAPAVAAQAWGRLAQALAGTVMRQAATSDLAHAMAGSAEEMAKIFPPNTPIGAMLISKSPVVRMVGMQEAGKAAVLNNAPFTVAPDAEHHLQAGTQGVVTSGQPQSPQGRLERDTRLVQGPAKDTLQRVLSREAILPEGVPVPNMITGGGVPVPTGPPKLSSGPLPSAAVPTPQQPTPDEMTNAKQKLGKQLTQVAQSGVTAPSATGMDEVAILPGRLGVAKATMEAPQGALKDYNEKSIPANEAAQKTLKSLDMIDQNIEKLGPKWMGAGAETRLEAAKIWNTALDTAGLSNVGHFDQTKVSTGEDFLKESKRLGFELSKALGSREAQQIVQQAISANPHIENSYLGAKYVSASIRADAGRAIELHNYKTDLVKAGKSLVGADVDFNKLHPPKEYAMRAITSQIPPEAIDDLRANPKTSKHFNATFGPGIAEYLLKTK